ncbi:MAG: cyclic pyranopterin monophosphate synthase MoaC [bacterium]
MSSKLTHLDKDGHARMVDVGSKSETRRTAIARADVITLPETLEAVIEGTVSKGDVLAAARIAGIIGGKKTSDLIPLTHPIAIDSLKVDLTPDKSLPGVRIEATVSTHGKTGVEMEALTAVTISALTIYDMLKSMDRGIRIENVRLTFKEGGKSGTYKAD